MIMCEMRTRRNSLSISTQILVPDFYAVKVPYRYLKQNCVSYQTILENRVPVSTVHSVSTYIHFQIPAKYPVKTRCVQTNGAL